MVRLLPLLLAAAAVPALSQSAPAPAPDPFVAADARATVDQLATALDRNFVFPDKGQAYAAMLRTNLQAGNYDHFADAKAFADRVSDDLQSVYPDRHLRLHVIPPEDRVEPSADGPGPGLPEGSAVTKAGELAPGVAYIAFGLFPGNEATLADLRKFLDANANADTLIIDARKHRGGGLAEMDMIFGEIFDKPTGLVMMDTRRASEAENGNPLEGFTSLSLVPTKEDVVRRLHTARPDATPTGLRKAKVYYLTSSRTASAAEHLALSFKISKRATLVGETTRGAGHYGGMIHMGSIYAAFIPVGRTFDPATNQGWEGVGVKPDVAVSADKALDEALRLAGKSISGEQALAALR